MKIAPRCNTHYYDNIINLNQVKRKIYDDFNTFNHQDPPTTNPIDQRNALLWVMNAKNTPELSSPQRDVLSKIIIETVCRGFYYTYVSQQKIVDEVGISKRSVVYAIKKLQELGWIAVKPSNRKPYRNITDINIEKIMALGTKGTESAKNEGAKDSSAGDALHKRTLKDTSREVSTIAPKTGAIEDREKLKEKVSRKKKPHKLKLTTGSVTKTWISAWNDNSCGNVRKYFLSRDEMLRLSTVLGNNRVRGKWIGSTEDLHKFVEWTIAHWEYLRYRQSWAKKAPQEPNVGWFVSQIYEIQCIWREETETKPKEPEIDPKEKWRKKRAERWGSGQNYN